MIVCLLLHSGTVQQLQNMSVEVNTKVQAEALYPQPESISTVRNRKRQQLETQSQKSRMWLVVVYEKCQQKKIYDNIALTIHDGRRKRAFAIATLPRSR